MVSVFVFTLFYCICLWCVYSCPSVSSVQPSSRIFSRVDINCVQRKNSLCRQKALTSHRYCEPKEASRCLKFGSTSLFLMLTQVKRCMHVHFYSCVARSSEFSIQVTLMYFLLFCWRLAMGAKSACMPSNFSAEQTYPCFRKTMR